MATRSIPAMFGSCSPALYDPDQSASHDEGRTGTVYTGVIFVFCLDQTPETTMDPGLSPVAETV